MTTYFAEVLAIEDVALTQVMDGASMACWRRRVVREVLKPESPYASALHQTTDADARPAFLVAWREMLTAAVRRVQHAGALPGTGQTAARTEGGAPDAERLAVLILAALHGGVALSRLAKNPAPLDAALDIALAPLAPPSPPSPPDDPGPSTARRTVT